MEKPLVFDTPESINFFRLCSLRGMLKLEKIGMKTRGGALRPRIAAEFGLKPRDSHDKFIAKIQSLIDEAHERKQDGLSKQTDESATGSQVQSS